jgi:hypothetical protein
MGCAELDSTRAAPVTARGRGQRYLTRATRSLGRKHTASHAKGNTGRNRLMLG